MTNPPDLQGLTLLLHYFECERRMLLRPVGGGYLKLILGKMRKDKEISTGIPKVIEIWSFSEMLG